jgi:hypothetical protein
LTIQYLLELNYGDTLELNPRRLIVQSKLANFQIIKNSLKFQKLNHVNMFLTTEFIKDGEKNLSLTWKSRNFRLAPQERKKV